MCQACSGSEMNLASMNRGVGVYGSGLRVLVLRA